MTFSKKEKKSLNARPKVDTVRYGKVNMSKHLKRTYVHTFAHDSKRELKKLITLVATFCCTYFRDRVPCSSGYPQSC